MNIGILALQGGFIEHAECFQRLDCQTTLIKSANDMTGIDALVVPGGESTAMNSLMFPEVVAWIEAGRPFLGTCAGAILFAKVKPKLFQVTRNAYGSQKHSFIAQVEFADQMISGVFIRAPKFTQVKSKRYIIATLDAQPVGIAYQQQMALSFHPELTDSLVVHQYFLGLIK